MGSHVVSMNTPYDIHVRDDFGDTGWSISGGKAIHSGCSVGYIQNKSFSTVIGGEYTITYTVSGYISGSVNAVVGGDTGETITANGTYIETFTAVDTSGIRFWSDGELIVELVSISTGELNSIPGRTIVFNQKHNVFIGERSYDPEMAISFIDDNFMFKNGQLWKAGASNIRNNFFGQQYESKITFYVNLNPNQIKNFHSMRVKSNKVWSVPEIKISPREGKENGQLSRIKKNNFKSYQGDWFADFLKDLNDPRFSGNELGALFNGADLQGGVAEITIENNDISEVRLISIDVEVSPQNYTF